MTGKRLGHVETQDADGRGDAHGDALGERTDPTQRVVAASPGCALLNGLPSMTSVCHAVYGTEPALRSHEASMRIS